MKYLPNQKGVIHTLPLLVIIASVGIISFLLISSTFPLGGLLGILNPKPQSHAAIPGDITGPDGGGPDGVVDIYDYNLLLSQFGQTGTNLKADITGPNGVPDGVVDIYDYNLLLTNFGKRESPAPSATPLPSILPSPSSSPSGGDGSNSHAMGIWNPNSRYDNCPSYPAGITSDQQRVAYIKSIHDSYKVKGPDGKWYPTWHPAIDPATGCKFGHEHGRDPSQSLVWQQVKDYFVYTRADGSKDYDHAGLPFGYTNEVYDVYLAAQGKTGMVHEDHVGHKVEWANDETDIAGTQFSQTKNTGVWIVDLHDPVADTGVRCFFLAHAHQGTSNKGAFTINLHEVFYFADCRHPNPVENQKISTAMLMAFGNPGGFTSFAPMCGLDRRGDPRDLVCPLGKDATGKCIKDPTMQNFPLGPNGDREIITRECVEIGFLVPTADSNVFSGNFYEAWPVSLEVTKPDGTTLASGINLLFDVEDANRYYYPESLKQQRGYNNPDAGTNLGFSMDLCYDRSVPGRIYHGGPCDYATQYGTITDIKWDDPRSAFKGIHRGMYFQPAVLNNAGGPEFWYTDPFGGSASITPFPGSIKQQVPSKNLEYGHLINGRAIDPRVNDRSFDDGGGTVHAPN